MPLHYIRAYYGLFSAKQSS
jgi:hypothetical protein